MQVIYTGEEMPQNITKTLFLAGVSKRPGQEDLQSWRDDAIKILEDKGFDGLVICPETRNGKFEKDFSYDDQVEWEHKYLNLADCILFWLPRDLSLDKSGNMKCPGFTSNVEFGLYAKSGKVVFGCPSNIKERKNTYIKHCADLWNIPTGETLTETIDAALDFIGDGAPRAEGERHVPAFIWNTDSFQSWYLSQKSAGNRLDHAELLWQFSPKKDRIYAWVLKVDVFIEAEKRHKTNEFVLARPDISSVLLWKKNDPILTSEVVIVKEFRSPAATPDGFIRELPSGSSAKKDEDPKDVATHEVFEETGFNFEPSRLKQHQSRQLAGTFSSHKAHFYSLELSDEELKWFKSQKDITHGNKQDSERTFVEVYDVQSLLNSDDLDWTNIGMMLSVLVQE